MYLISLRITTELCRAAAFNMTTATYILGLAITILTSSSSNGNLVVPSHPTLLQHVSSASPALRHNHKLATVVNHVGLKSLSKGLHTRIPVLPRVPLSVLSVGAKLKPHLVHSKPLTSPILPVSRLSQLNIRSADIKNKTEKSTDQQPQHMKNESNAKIDRSIVSNTSGINNASSSNDKSSDLNGSMDELDYLSTAANPVDVSESQIIITTKSNQQEFKYKLQKANSTSSYNRSQNVTKISDDQATLVPYKILAHDSLNNNYESESIATSAGNKMNDYLRVMNVSRNFHNPSYQSNQTKPLINVLNDFQKSLSQSLLWQNGKSSIQQNNNNQTLLNYNNNLNDYKYEYNSNSTNRLWNSTTNVTDDVTKKIFDTTGNFGNIALTLENGENNKFVKNGYPLEGEYRSHLQSGYPSAYQSQTFLQNTYSTEHQTQPYSQSGFSNIPGIANINPQANTEYYNNRQLENQPFYNVGYYQANNPPASIWNPAVNLAQNIAHSDPDVILNPTNQYLISRRYRQMPATNYERLSVLGQTSSINNQEINSASSIINSALNLAQSIVGGDYKKIIRSSINMGTDISNAANRNRVDSPQSFKRNIPYESISNSETAFFDRRENDVLKYKNNENDKIFKTINRLPNINSNLVDSIDTSSINSNNTENDTVLTSINSNAYSHKSIPIQQTKNSGIILTQQDTPSHRNDQMLGSPNILNINKNLATDLATSKTDKIRITSRPYMTEQIWNLAAPLSTNIGNTAINPRLLEIRRILRSPYGTGTYLGVIPLRTLYNPVGKIGDPLNIPKNPTQLGPAFLYL